MCYQFVEGDNTLEMYKSGICKCGSFNEGKVSNNTFTPTDSFSINADKTVLSEQFIEM